LTTDPVEPLEDRVERWSARVLRVLAPNPSPMTLEGTNTYVIAEPGGSTVAVIDPGPAIEEHAGRVARACGGRRVELVLLTHTHPDHAEGAAAFADAAGAPLAAVDQGIATPGSPRLEAGGVLEVAGLEVVSVPTPGHAADHCSFLLPAERALFSGDHVLGRGSTVVAWPDGDLRSYMRSLELLEGLDLASLYPGHGPLVADAPAKVAEYLAHRRERERQIIEALDAGARTVDDIVDHVYADLDGRLRFAAGMSVRAHLDKLVAEGRARQDGDIVEPLDAGGR
jgi:glyoxylase-like metal-dependent hydrolase (beta-lactamase superfamily II)